MSTELHNIFIPSHALNHCATLCENCDCIFALEKFHQDIVTAVDKADQTLPRRKHGIAKPFWNSELSVLKAKSFDAHTLWKDCGYPRSGPIFDEKIRANCEYKLCLRKSKNTSQRLLSDSLCSSLQSKDYTCFWSKWKQINGTHVSNSTMVDGFVNHKKIANMFANSYKSIYSQSNANNDLKREFKERYSNYCNMSANVNTSAYLFTWDDMKETVASLKIGKATSTFIKAEHILYGCPELLRYLHLLFNGLLTHSYLPHEFLLGTISPIIKDPRGDCASSNNYRPITLGPIFLQIFENLLLKKFNSYLNSDDLQFAYKPSHSTAHALFVLRSCVDYYVAHGSNVLVTFLDCSKAFDTISHYGIFLKLMDRGVPICFLKLIIYWYLNMKSRVRWENEFSDYFEVLSGVKQGGVLSPRIFTLYVDTLIQRLKRKGVGCHLFSHFVACIMYADDLCLMAPSRSAMQQLLSICAEFCKESCLAFNAKKSKALSFGKRDVNLISPLTLDNEKIEFVSSWKYLGCTILSGKDLSFSTTSELSSFHASCNSIMRSVRRPNELVLMNLLYSNCVPSLTYCAEVRELANNDMHKCNVALNDTIRRIFTFHRWESTRQLRVELGFPNLYEIFASRKKCFAHKNRTCSNVVIRELTCHL